MKYYESFSSRNDILEQFEITSKELEKCIILFASYAEGSYEGDSFVLFKKGRDLYEVNAGHCSCYGLEGQWKPELTSWAALEQRKEGALSTYSHDVETIKAFRKLVARHTKKP